MELDEKLIYGLPCIEIDKKYYIFSPYKKKVAEVDISNLDRLKETLIEKGYIGKISPYGPTYYQKTGQLTLVVTKACQLRCLYCNVNAGDEYKNMDLSLAYKAVDLFLNKSKYLNNIITFFGGEPTIRWKEIENIIQYANNKAKLKGKKLKFSLSTNGVLNDEQIEFLKKYKFSIIVSIDGIKNIQNMQRPLIGNKESFDIVYNNIKKFKENNIPFKINAVVTEFSVNYIIPFVDEMIKLGAKQIQLDPVSHAGKALENPNQYKIRPDYKVYLKEYFKAVSHAEKYGVAVFNQVSGRLFKPANYFCDLIASDIGFVVSYNGLISKCIEVQDEKHECSDQLVIGDIKGDAININNEKIIEIRKKALINNKECENCFARYFCAGGCTIRNFHNNNTFKKTDDYYCKIAKNTTKWFIRKFVGKEGVIDENCWN